MIEMKSHDLPRKTFRLLQQADDADPESVILKTKGGIRFKAWDLTGCVVKTIMLRQGEELPTFPSSEIVDIAEGLVEVDFTDSTAVTWEDGQRHLDAMMEFEVTKSDASKETVPAGDYIRIRLFRDLDGV